MASLSQAAGQMNSATDDCVLKGQSTADPLNPYAATPFMPRERAESRLKGKVLFKIIGLAPYVAGSVDFLLLLECHKPCFVKPGCAKRYPLSGTLKSCQLDLSGTEVSESSRGVSFVGEYTICDHLPPQRGSALARRKAQGWATAAGKSFSRERSGRGSRSRPGRTSRRSGR